MEDLNAQLDRLGETATRLADGLIAQRDEARADAVAAQVRIDAGRREMDSVRECVLNLFAEAQRFDEDVDGEYHTDCPTPTVTVRYFCEFGESELRELVEALGLAVAYDETAGAALKRRLDADAKAFAATFPHVGASA